MSAPIDTSIIRLPSLPQVVHHMAFDIITSTNSLRCMRNHTTVFVLLELTEKFINSEVSADDSYSVIRERLTAYLTKFWTEHPLP